MIWVKSDSILYSCVVVSSKTIIDMVPDYILLGFLCCSNQFSNVVMKSDFILYCKDQTCCQIWACFSWKNITFSKEEQVCRARKMVNFLGKQVNLYGIIAALLLFAGHFFWRNWSLLAKSSTFDLLVLYIDRKPCISAIQTRGGNSKRQNFGDAVADTFTLHPILCHKHPWFNPINDKKLGIRYK